MVKGKDAGARWIVGLAALCLVATGCGRLRVGWLGPQRDADRVSQTVGQSSPSAREDEADPGEVLNAVAEFLERTQEYALTDSDSTLDNSAIVAAANETAVQPGSRLGASEGVVPMRGESDPAPGAVANARLVLDEPEPAAPTLARPVVRLVSIRSTSGSPSHVEAAPKCNTANHPLTTTTSTATATADALLRRMAAVAKDAGDFDSRWRLGLVRGVLGHADHDEDDKDATLSSDAKQILDAVLRVVSAAKRVAADPLLPGAGALREATHLTAVLAERADPIVASVALCRRVVTFGIYDEIAPEALLAGRSIPAIVYTEVGNFTSEPTEEGRYRTVLATRLEILTADGRSMWDREEPEIVDTCRTRRKDFFIAQRITLPATLPAGDYVLKILVEDKLSGKANEATLPFTMAVSSAVADKG